jgi:hypothetical protein
VVRALRYCSPHAAPANPVAAGRSPAAAAATPPGDHPVWGGGRLEPGKQHGDAAQKLKLLGGDEALKAPLATAELLICRM